MVTTGASRELVLVDDLTRTQIVQYAGASGDYNPIHTDERYAVEVGGFRSVFAHGMLTMGMTGRVLTDWFGPEAVQLYRARFIEQVWPGDALMVSAVVTSIEETGAGRVASVELTTRNQHGRTVLTGVARVSL